VLFASLSGHGSFCVAPVHAFFNPFDASTSIRCLHSSTISAIHLNNTMHSIDDHDNNNGTSPIDDVASLLATANHARQRPKHIPRHTSNSYMDYALHRTTALRTAIHHLEQELGAHSPISHMSLGTDKLTLHPHPSQSKLSQQELGELQKATHFDKKELQQWYKGEAELESQTCKPWR